MKEFVSCGLCDKGYIYSHDRQSVVKCDCLKKYQKEILLEINKQKAGIENFNHTIDEYKGNDINNNIGKLKIYMNNIDGKFANSNHLYFYGENGTQKTTLAKVILADALSKNLTGKFVSMFDLMGIVCPAFQEDENKQLTNFLATCNLLIIDDCFSAKKVTLYKNSKSYQMSFLDAFLRKRLEQNKKNTIFTSNVRISEIEANDFSYDIMDLLTREIEVKKGELVFTDKYIDKEHDIDIKSMWD